MQILSSHTTRGAYCLVSLLYALSLFFRYLRHGLRQPVGDQLIRVVTAHLSAIGLGVLLVVHAGVDLELRIGLAERLLRGWATVLPSWTLLAEPQCSLHVGK